MMVLLMLSGVALAAGRANPSAVEVKWKPEDGEGKLIALLGSDAAKGDKAIACKNLAIYGSKAAVPALGALLPDPELTSWARIALEAIPGPEADEALRNALDKTQGRVLTGVINSIAVRRDAKATDALIQKLKDADAEVASVAAVALGRIGTEPAAKALEGALASAPAGVRSAVAEGCILCAEAAVAAGKRDEGVRIFDLVRKADLPKQRLVEATRGAILSRQAAGIPLLVENLRSPDKELFAVALRAAREMTDGPVTETLIAEMPAATPEHRALLIYALADRGDAKSLPAVVEAAKSGPLPVRLAAVTVLETLGNVTCIPVLLDAAVDPDPQLAQTARTTLARLQGKDVEAELLSRISKSTGKMRQTLMELAGERRIDGAVAAIMAYVADADPAVRSTALDTIGAIADDNQAADLVKLAQKTAPADRGDIEKALMAICGRWADKCVQYVRPLAQSEDAGLRIMGLHTLACAGGSDALGAVKAALDDKDSSVQDEAVRTLSTWPNRWPEDGEIVAPLLGLAKSATKMQHKVLALRGYLQYVQSNKKLNDAEKMAKIDDVMPLLARPEEKRLAISALSAIGTGRAMQHLVTLAGDADIGEEACSAILKLAGRAQRPLPQKQRMSALQAVVEKTKNAGTKKKAEDMLKTLR
jgi:HEAT repeat protein